MSSSQEVRFGKYKKKKCVGAGSFGQVWLVEDPDTRTPCVIKRIVMAGAKPKEIKDAEREVEILKMLDHPNVINYMDSFQDQEGFLNIVMEYAPNGDLGGLISKNSKDGTQLDEQEIAFMTFQMLQALKYVHSVKIIHRDIKPQNVLVGGNNELKLADFGIAKILSDNTLQAHSVVGTPFYMPPELCKSKPYAYQSDVWSLGCVIYELCTLKRAFERKNLLAVAKAIELADFEPIPPPYSPRLCNMIKKMLTVDLVERPSVEGLITEFFIEQIRSTPSPCNSVTTSPAKHHHTPSGGGGVPPPSTTSPLPPAPPAQGHPSQPKLLPIRRVNSRGEGISRRRSDKGKMHKEYNKWSARIHRTNPTSVTTTTTPYQSKPQQTAAAGQQGTTPPTDYKQMTKVTSQQQSKRTSSRGTPTRKMRPVVIQQQQPPTGGERQRVNLSVPRQCLVVKRSGGRLAVVKASKRQSGKLLPTGTPCGPITGATQRPHPEPMVEPRNMRDNTTPTTTTTTTTSIHTSCTSRSPASTDIRCITEPSTTPPPSDPTLEQEETMGGDAEGGGGGGGGGGDSSSSGAFEIPPEEIDPDDDDDDEEYEFIFDAYEPDETDASPRSLPPLPERLSDRRLSTDDMQAVKMLHSINSQTEYLILETAKKLGSSFSLSV